MSDVSATSSCRSERAKRPFDECADVANAVIGAESTKRGKVGEEQEQQEQEKEVQILEKEKTTPAGEPPEAIVGSKQQEGIHGEGACGSCGHEEHGGLRTSMVTPPPDSFSADSQVVTCASFEAGAAVLSDHSCIAARVLRPLTEATARAFADYVTVRPLWPHSDELRPLESTHERSAVIDFEPQPPMGGGDALAGASGYGRELPPRFSPARATARAAITQVLSVLPPPLAAIAGKDAEALLTALREKTMYREYVLRLELILGDTCQKWHCDQNVSRSLITYVGPGTVCAHEEGVTRNTEGHVDGVEPASSVQASVGDVIMMKGGLWKGLRGRGTAHRAPSIGAVPVCKSYRVVLKVDILEDEWDSRFR